MSFVEPQPKLAVFVHGAGGGGWEWFQWLPSFQKAGWHCLAQDLEPTAEGISATRFDDYLRQVVGWTNSFHSINVVLIGASMGGLLAMKAAESVQPTALILINSVPPAGISWKPNPAGWPDIIEWSTGSFEETTVAMPDSEASVIALAHQSWRDESGAVLRDMAAGIPVKRPNCPCLVMIGKADTDIEAGIGREIVSSFGAESKSYEGFSHLGPLLGIRASELIEDALHWIESKVQ